MSTIRLPKPGEVLKIQPFAEEAEVYLCEQQGEVVTLGVIFQKSKRADKFIFSVATIERLLL